MTHFILFDASCPFEYTNWQVFTIREEQSLEPYLRIDLEETIKYASTLRTTLRVYSLTKWIQANWMSFDDNWTSCTNLAEIDHAQAHMERVACS